MIQRRRAVFALVTVMAVFVALVVPLVTHAIAQGTPRVQILNPSGYSDDGVDETPLFVSDLLTGTDETDDPNEDTYRLNAWTGATPVEALVEFELQIAPGQNITLGTADRVASDTFEFNWDISVPDGPYVVRAILYEGSGLFAEEVARSERAIIINRGDPTPDPSPTIDIVYPPNGGQAGVYTNPLTGATNILVDVEWSSDTDYIEVFYTLSDPGDDPVWKVCATSGQGGSAGSARLRCDLESQDQGGQSVTGIAAMTNDDDTGNASPELNASGDAVRIFPYDQDASSIDIDRDTVRANSANGDWTSVCSPAQFATVRDQLDRPIGNLNIDVHAAGPSDQTKFFSGGDPFGIFGPPSDNKEPDNAHGTELAYFCDFPEQTEFTGLQGDHNRVGAPDVKHVESTGGAGAFGVSVHADTEGVSFLTFWADEDNDDTYCSQELAVPASIGFDSPAPAPVLEPAGKEICPVPTPPPPGTSPGPSGSPSPSPSETPPEDPRGCTVLGTEGNDQLRGTEGDDVICGLGGDDEIEALGGRDTIHGDQGDDSINGAAGNDVIDGGGGTDAVFGGGGRDFIDGGADSDIVVGGGGNDTLRGNGGSDSILGGRGRDIMIGGSGSDSMSGGGGDDIEKAGTGRDNLEGGGGADTMRAGPQNDHLDGGRGPDTLRGGPGKDRCVGGPGRDRQSSC